ncbi:MAG: pyruvate kinase [Clostridia bacterium]|nr:pyruvate kinase [Clostridia bacterium]
MRRTKIVATLGPASSSEEVIEQMLKAGLNVARLNFSHGEYETHEKTIETFRKVRDKMKIPAAVMLDTKGPEIRIKLIKEDKVNLISGQTFTLTAREVEGDETQVSITYSDLPRQLVKGTKILIDDGRIILTVEQTTDTDIICRVIEGGVLSSRKSINVPNVSIDMPYMSEKDEQDILFGIEHDVDFVAASFVRRKEDVITLRKFIDYHGGHNIKIISKIENIEGVRNFDEILDHSDGIMVARGDMGVEVEFEKLPGIQKKFIKKCYRAGKMVITATQMLESMVTSYTPTRAEISDVANAVFDGTSAVMLSGETAMGAHPAHVIEVMSKIAEQAEADAFTMNYYRGAKFEIDADDVTNAICDAACTTAKDLHAKAVIAVTKSGQTARRVSKFRPDMVIVAATPEWKTFHQLALSWGVAPVLSITQDNTDKLFRHAIDCAKQIDLVEKGDTVVITAGATLNMVGTTNLLRVETIV